MSRISTDSGFRDGQDHLLDEMGGLLSHAPARTRGAKAAFLTAKRQQHLVGTGVTPQADKAVGQDAALQVGIKSLDDIIGQTFGGGIDLEGGQKRFQMLGDDLVEDRATGVSRLIDGRYHIPTFRRQQLLRSTTR